MRHGAEYAAAASGGQQPHLKQNHKADAEALRLHAARRLGDYARCVARGSEAAALYIAPYADKVCPVGAEGSGGVERLLLAREYRGAKLRAVMRPSFAYDELHRNMAAEFVYLRRERQVHKLTRAQTELGRGVGEEYRLEALLSEPNAHTQVTATADCVRRFKLRAENAERRARVRVAVRLKLVE